MQPSAFSEKSPGKLLKSTEGHWTFIPDPLPPKLDFSLEMIQLLSAADQALGRLAGLGEMLPNPHLLIGPFLRREAVLSSRIEGTITTPEELMLFEAAPSALPPTPDVREVANYVRALEHGLARLKELPVCLRLIREIHGVLLQGVRGTDRRPGQFRETQNYIGQPGRPIAEARFVPPPVAQMQDALATFEKFLHDESELPFLVKLALIHYQFEAIHPFLDGNGRIGRLLIPLLLCERSTIPQPLLYLSAYLERNRDIYMDLLLEVSKQGAWSDWIRFFLRGVAEQSEDAIRRSRRLMSLQQGYKAEVRVARASALLLRLVDELFATPFITAVQVRQRLKVTHATAQSNIEKLVSAGILKQYSGRRRNRVYYAPEILSVVSEEEGPEAGAAGEASPKTS